MRQFGYGIYTAPNHEGGYSVFVCGFEQGKYTTETEAIAKAQRLEVQEASFLSRR
jgi:hypothetical protein